MGSVPSRCDYCEGPSGTQPYQGRGCGYLLCEECHRLFATRDQRALVARYIEQHGGTVGGDRTRQLAVPAVGHYHVIQGTQPE